MKLKSLSVVLLLLGAVVLIGGTGAGRAPSAFSERFSASFGSGNTVGTPGSAVHALVAGDLDRDGDPDLVSADGQIAAWQNSGAPFSGPWTASSLGEPGVVVYALAIGDLDNDGDLDIASGSSYSATYQIQVWQNDGTPFDGLWTSGNVGITDVDVRGLAMADVDDDGRLDIVSGDSAGRLVAWWNNGTPFGGTWFSHDIGSAPLDGQVLSLAVGDLDRDGNVDVVSGDTANQVIAWQNPSSAFFDTWARQTVSTVNDDVASVALVDADADGDLDIIAGGGSGIDHPVSSWQNDGTPFSGAWTRHDIGKLLLDVYAVTVADLDVDGDPDLASGSQADASSAEVLAWENNGSPFAGTWSASGVGETGADVRALIAVDLDLDGDPDLVSATDDIVAWPNTRTPEALGAWIEGPQPAPTYDALSVALSDYNYDAKLDIAAGTEGYGIYVWQGDGGYSWVEQPVTGTGTLPSSGIWTDVAWEQINTRSYLDLAAASYGGGLRVWAADPGAGTFSWYEMSTGLPVSGNYRALDLGRIDHDPLPDLAACGEGLGVRAWRQEIDENWMPDVVLSGTLDFCDVALAHVDHDGNLDIVAANCGGLGIPVWLGNGIFDFIPTTPVTTGGSYEAVTTGDLDDDGNVDVVAAPQAGGVQVWLGDGGTAWADRGIISPTLTVHSLYLSDFDNDGHLDLLVGLQGGGLRVWQGDGGTSWVDTSTNLPTSGDYEGVAFGPIDGDASLDVVGAESGTSGVRVWTAVEPPPGGWADFEPHTDPPVTWVRTQQLTCTVYVADVGSGLDVSTAEYRFSRNGGTSWMGGWIPASVSGADGTTDPQVITAANVPFNQDSGTQNAIQFRIRDMNAYTGTSPIYYVAIDATPPTNPDEILSYSHVPGVWHSGATVGVTWTTGIDATSGPWAYSYDLTASPTSLPDTVPETNGDWGTASASAEGQNWWFHLRTQDRAGNWAADAVHVGPFWIDITPPTNPGSLWSSSHTPGVWSNDPTVTVWWTAGSDGAGSGVQHYAYSWDTVQQSFPGDGTTVGTGRTSGSLSTGNSWYFSLRTRDNVNRWASEALHLGPFWIDTIPPNSFAMSPDTVHETSFTVNCVSWESPTPQSGAASCEIQYKDKASGGWAHWQTFSPANGSATFTGQLGHTYCFRSRAQDYAGNLESWPTDPDGDWCTDIATNLSITAVEVNQAIQNLANDVPLVEGKETWVRVYVASTHFDIAGTEALLYGTRDGLALPDSPLSSLFAITARTNGGNRDVLGNAFLFALPFSWLNGTVQLTAEVNPNRTIAETTYGDNTYNLSAVFHRTHTLCVDMVRVHLHPSTYAIGDPGFWEMVTLLKRFYPVAAVQIYQGGTIYPYWHGFGSEWDLPNDYSWVLQKLWDYDNLHNDPCDVTHYYGMVDPASQTTGSAGMGYRPGDEAAGRMDAGGAWPTPLGGRTMAHELGHNNGRKHVNCTGDEQGGGDVDNNYPYPDTNPCRIADDDPTSYYGLFRPIGASLPEVISPTNAADLMSYGSRRWISDYTYRALYNKVVSGSSNQAADLPSVWLQAGEYLYVSGLITPTEETAYFCYFYVRDQVEELQLKRSWVHALDASAVYSLTLEDAGGGLLYAHPFTLTAISEQGNPTMTIPFGQVFPYNPVTARIALYHQGTELASRVVSAHPPTITLLSPAGGESFTNELPISWEASDGDGDLLVYALQYSPDNGATWLFLDSDVVETTLVVKDVERLPGSDQARIRIFASDGVNTALVTSAPFALSRHPPKVYITEPFTGSIFAPGEAVFFGGAVLDAEDGFISDTSRLVWTSDISGTLGTGYELVLTTLPIGTHHVTLTATDSDLMAGSATVVVRIATIRKVYLPVIRRE